MGIGIPEDLSIVGFNDFPPLPTMFHPYLTTIRQPLYEIGVEAVRCVFDSSNTLDNLQVKLKPLLIERETAVCRKKISRKPARHIKNG
jgi:DNA-binding LacI/PurR family transcriptional regulator